MLKKTVLNQCLLKYILQTYKKSETSKDIEDITDEQRKQSPVLYDYLKDTFEETKYKSQELVKRALYEFIILTGASYDPPADKKTKGVCIIAFSFSVSFYLCNLTHAHIYTFE